MFPIDFNRVCASWQRAARALNVVSTSPFAIKINGEEVVCVALIRDFGGPKGMILHVVEGTGSGINEHVQRYASMNGLYYSYLYPEAYLNYDEDVFKEALIDWGYYGPSTNRPDWLVTPTI